MAAGKAEVVEGNAGEEYFSVSFAGPTVFTGKGGLWFYLEELST